MSILNTLPIFLFILTINFTAIAQDDVIIKLEEAKKYYLKNELTKTANLLDQASEIVNKKIISQLESIFPDPVNGWTKEAPSSRIKKNAYSISLESNCQYLKNSGGTSVNIKLEKNAVRISRLRRIFINPSAVSQLGDNAKISSVKGLRCIERLDPIDKFAELMFIPTSNLMVTIRGFEVKNTKFVTKYAEKINWKRTEQLFP